MALNKIGKKGYGVVELNNPVPSRTGQVESYCELATDFTETSPAENGMILMVDVVQKEAIKPDSTAFLPYALLYTSEALYDDAKTALDNFATYHKDGNLSRLFYLSVGTVFTTNTVSYDTADFADEDAVKAALGKTAQKTAPVYGVPSADGYIQLVKTLPADGIVLACSASTMPNGEFGIEFYTLRP